MDFLSLPEFSREALAEMGGWTVLRQAKGLFESGKVEDVAWEKPVLSGVVRDGEERFEPQLDLRSMTFVRNKCGCRTGRSGQVCPHAVALCLAARKLEAAESSTDVRSARQGGGGRVLLPQNWMVVDGSTKYLSIMLREKEHPQYQRCTEWLRSEGFRHEPSNGKWWLRDQHKVLNFLSLHRKLLEADYDPGYTEGFKERTRFVEPVELDCQTDKSRSGYSLRLELKAGDTDIREIRNYLVSGCHYIVRDAKIFLIERETLGDNRSITLLSYL